MLALMVFRLIELTPAGKWQITSLGEAVLERQEHQLHWLAKHRSGIRHRLCLLFRRIDHDHGGCHEDFPGAAIAGRQESKLTHKTQPEGLPETHWRESGFEAMTSAAQPVSAVD